MSDGKGATYITLYTELPILYFSSVTFKLKRVPQFYRDKCHPKATPINQPQMCCLTEAATITMPQLLLNRLNSMILPQLASIMLLLSQPHEHVLALLGNLPF